MATTHIYACAGMWRGGKRPGVFRMKLGNGGFEQLRNGLPDPASVHAITVHPDDPSLVFIGTQDGIYRSTDHGNTWAKPDFPDAGVQIWSILVHPGAPQTILAGAAPTAVYRSDDSGEHWRRIARPTMPERVKMDFPCRVMRLAIDPKRPDDVFAIVEVNGVMRSRDGGESWSDCSAGLIRLASRDGRSDTGRLISILYFANSIGAAAGVLIAGFYLIGAAGLPGTILTAAIINLLVGLTVF